jgi:23S rRNA (adenine2503-C2)-methyltransferase
MGMGEPMANYDEMIRAVKILTHPRGFGLGQRHITISTIGIASGIEKLADENLQIGLAISLHAPTNDLRKKLVPTAKDDSVEEIIESGRYYFKRTGRRVTFEYALMDGINDSPDVAHKLAKLLRGNGSHVNLIPINPTAGDFKRPSNNRVHEFERILSKAGINCTIRIEKGTEISAACGQLRTDIVG